jgi:hypothetical protein
MQNAITACDGAEHDENDGSDGVVASQRLGLPTRSAPNSRAGSDRGETFSYRLTYHPTVAHQIIFV